MTAELSDKLAAYGIDYADAMSRFGNNTALFERLALKYLEDSHYVGLVAALEVEDFEEGYRQAHSLKGVAGNLSFTRLYNVATLVSNALHEGEYHAAESFMPDVKQAHELVIAGLERLQNHTL